MMLEHRLVHCLFLVLASVSAAPIIASAADQDLAPLIEAVNGVRAKGHGHRDAIAAWQQLVQVDAARLPEVLAGMDSSGILAENWMRAAVESIAQRQSAAGGDLPVAAIEVFLSDRSHAPRARRLAYELLLDVDPGAQQRWQPKLLDDPSLELRRVGVSYALDQAAALLAAGKRVESIAAYTQALTFARARDQVDAAADQLRDLGQPVDLPRHFGFIVDWKLIAPFDNTDTRGFDVAYGPEVDLDPKAKYQGKDGVVRWIDTSTEDPYGNVDLNVALGRFKGAVAYAYAEFLSDRDRDAEFRLGCINGNKVWLNGKLLTANHVYHSGSYMDQYNAKGQLKKGRNVILLKITQNEQSESWAQGWQFQLRVCDQFSTAILSQDRK